MALNSADRERARLEVIIASLEGDLADERRSQAVRCFAYMHMFHTLGGCRFVCFEYLPISCEKLIHFLRKLTILRYARRTTRPSLSQAFPPQKTKLQG